MASGRRNDGEMILPVDSKHAGHAHPEALLPDWRLGTYKMCNVGLGLAGDTPGSGMYHGTVHALLAKCNRTAILQAILAYPRRVPYVSLGKEKSHCTGRSFGIWVRCLAPETEVLVYNHAGKVHLIPPGCHFPICERR